MVAWQRFQWLSLVGLLAGLTLFTSLVIWQGWTLVAQSLGTIGWRLLALPLWFGIPFLCAIRSWRSLFPPQQAPSWKLTAYLTWVGLGVNWLLPVAQVGGELLRARLLHKRHFSLGVSLASVVGDKTLQAMTQGLYTLIGLTLLSYRWGDRPLILGGLISAVLLTLGALGFYRVQQLGLFRLSAQVAQRLRRKSTLADLKETATTIDVAIEAMYRRRNQLFWALLWRMGFRLTLAGEVWLATRLLRHPVSPVEAIILESLGQGIRASAFVVPAGLGVQESSFLLVGLVLGLPAPTALLLSICKRVRELLVGVPGLIMWQWEEGVFLLRSRDRR